MSPAEMIALSLGLSIAVAAVAGLAALGLERASGDPALRERAWATALYLPALPPLAVALMLPMPAPVAPAMVLPTLVAAAPSVETATVVVAPVAETFQMDWGLVVMAVLALAALLIAARLVSLVWRAARLNRLVGRATAASDAARDAVAAIARILRVAVPSVRATDSGAEALLAGLIRPVLILPAALAGAPEAPAARAVIAHELAHLKRGDHRAVWVEEALLAILAVNPVLPLIRARRAAAREEACDALALSGAEPAHRRAYAQSLIEALRARTDLSPAVALPALTFTGTPRSRAMRRLKSILTPPTTAGRGTKTVAMVAGVTLLGLAGTGSLAVAAQRATQAAPDADAAMPLATSEHAYLDAAMTPIFKAAWPGACGFGSDGPNGRVFVHSGEGCPTLAGPRILIQTLAGADPSADPRAAFMAVKAACDAGRPVDIAFTQGGRSDTTTVVCASAPVVPPEPVRFTADIAYDPAILIAAGDRLEITLERDMGGDGTASTSMVLDLAPGALPGQAFADLRPPLLPADRNGPMFAMSARIMGADGKVKARSDRDLGRAHAPYVNGPGSISTDLRMVAVPAASASPLQDRLESGVGYVAAEGIEQVSEEAAAALPQPAAGTTRLWLALDADGSTLTAGDTLVVELSGEGEGVRNSKRATTGITPAGMPGLMFLDLGPEYFPSLGGANRAYDLNARIERGDRIVAAAQSSTVRLAAGSQGSLSRLRPLLRLEPVAR